jgi:hypothetical protein
MNSQTRRAVRRGLLALPPTIAGHDGNILRQWYMREA